MTNRHCIACKAEIDKCDGIVLARDLTAEFWQRGGHARELCGRCVLMANKFEQWRDAN
jgi:hypothetical protein